MSMIRLLILSGLFFVTADIRGGSKSYRLSGRTHEFER